MERTHLALTDQNWLPASINAARVAALVGSTAAGIAGAFALSTHAPDYALMGGGGVFLGSTLSVSLKVVGTLLRRRATPIELAQLATVPDGELVRVRGRVRVRVPLRAFLNGRPGVYRRMRFAFDRTARTAVIHEAAVDFALGDAAGTQIWIETGDARLIARPPKMAKYDDEFQERFLSLPLPDRLQSRARRGLALVAEGRSHHLLPIHAGEVLIGDGDEIEVIGYKSRVIDPTVADRLARDTPMRITLRGGKMPLVLFSAA